MTAAVLRPEVQILHLEGDPRLVLWHNATGRHLRVAEPDLRVPSLALERRLAELRMIGASLGLGALYPAPSRWALLLPDDRALLHPLPMHRGAGGFPFGAQQLSEAEMVVWRLCNGARTVSDIALRSGVALDALTFFFRRLTAVHVQALQLRETPTRAREPSLEQLLAPPRPQSARPEGLYDAAGATTLNSWHQQINDGPSHFDEGETTFAHAFHPPHPALQGRSYGEALADALLRHGLMPRQGPVLEIGPGSGELCSDLRPALPEPLRSAPYTRLDLSPALLAEQERRNPDTLSVLGDCTQMPVPDGSLGLVICNEVIADLRASPDPEGWALQPEPEQRLFNTGAFRLLAELWRTLKPGGLAFLSEFGAEDELPTETTQLDHPEVSIHFGQLFAVARSLGFEAWLQPLGPWLGVDMSARWLARSSFEALRARLDWDGETLEARAWTPETLRLPFAVEGLRWVSLAEDGPAPLITRLMVLLIRKPEAP